MVPPDNDDFADATQITSNPPHIEGRIGHPTSEAVEPDPRVQRSVWYRFTAPRSERLYVQSEPTIDVFTGDGLNALTPVPLTSMNMPPVHYLDVTAGQCYVIRVAGGEGVSFGRFVVNFTTSVFGRRR